MYDDMIQSGVSAAPDPDATPTIKALYLERHGHPNHIMVPAADGDWFVPLCNGPDKRGGRATVRLIPESDVDDRHHNVCKNCLRSLRAQQ